MNLLQFIRILLKNIVILFVVPIIMSILVFYLTRNESKLYTSETIIYTGIASGYNIESKGGDKVDFFATNNAFDNLINMIKSRETLEKDSISLLAQNLMLDKPVSKYISYNSYNELQQLVPQNIKQVVDKTSFEKTYNNLLKIKNSNEQNFVYELINYNHPHYSFNAISKINVRRIQSSDLLQISYKTDDPGICMQTLILVTKCFSENYRMLKEVQTDDVIHYFEEQVARTSNNLKQSEDELLNFNKDNKIINYYEQTKYIAAKKEDLDVNILEIQMNYASAVNTLKELEKKLTDKDKIFLKSEEIIQKRNKLAAINSRISLTEIYNEDNNKENENLKKLKQEADLLQKHLQDDVSQLYLYGHSREGIPLQELLSQWLTYSIKKEENKSSLDVLFKRKNEFGAIYSQFAPLGATMKRIERKIGVTENEYLELLHSLTLAKLKQQNVQLSSTLKVVDPPFFPLKPQASKRKILVVVAGLMGFIIVLVTLVLREYFDSSIKTADRIFDKTNIPLAGIFPFINIKDKNVDNNYLSNRMIELISQNIKKNLDKNYKKDIQNSFIVLIFSTKNKDGKTYIGKLITDKFREFGENAYFLNYCQSSDKSYNQNLHQDDACYIIDNEFFKINSFEHLLLTNNISLNKYYKYIFIEIPSIINNLYPADLVKDASLSLLITRSNRAWSKADTYALDVYKEISNNKIESVLNGVDLEQLESIIGEIPKKRSFLRKQIKKLLLFKKNL